jgi:hypothetical protein
LSQKRDEEFFDQQLLQRCYDAVTSVNVFSSLAQCEANQTMEFTIPSSTQ